MDDVDTVDRAENQLAEDPADFVGRSTDADELLGAIRKLPCDQQRALVLKFAHGLKNHEIGEKLGRSEGAVKQLVHRAMGNLRATLEDDNVS